MFLGGSTLCVNTEISHFFIQSHWEVSEGVFPPEQGPCPYMNMIWLHCDGEDDPDIENIGPVTYTPFRGFPGYFYPYRNQRGYLSPIVMVQLKNPMPGVSGTT